MTREHVEHSLDAKENAFFATVRDQRSIKLVEKDFAFTMVFSEREQVKSVKEKEWLTGL